MNRWLVFLVLFLFLGLGGCLTPAVQKQKPGEVTAGPKRPKPVAIYEEDTTAHLIQAFKDTSTAKGPIMADTTKGAMQNTVQAISVPIDTAKAVAPQAPQETTATVPPKTIPGFRVQVFASTSQVNAERVLQEARTLLGEKTYLEFTPPLYKVRVGNFLTQQEALSLKDRAIEKGYKAAFVVETDIEF
jgi:hypothetical protein